MTRARVGCLGWLATLALCTVVHGEESVTYEKGPDGVTYQVTRRVVPRSIPTTEYQTREQKVYRPQTTVEYQTHERTYVTPVTEYRWVPRLRGWWNPFSGAYWSYDLEPVTRWETMPGTVRIPVARTNWVEETRTAQVPVTTYRTVKEEYVSRVAVSASPSSSNGNLEGQSQTSIARRYGGQQLENDPPSQPAETYRR